MSPQEIKQHFASSLPQTLAWRRHLHTWPELSFAEKETSAYIAQQLSALGIPFKTGYAEHGIAAFVTGTAKPEAGQRPRTVVLRADIDALPIEEDKAHECLSKNSGVMHACGHDMHTASLLAVAAYAQSVRSEFAGTLMFVFQPGEECDPGGARLMMRDGLFDGIEPYAVVGAHVLADMPVGHVGFCAGNYMASGDEIHLRVKGKGGHGGMPHLLNDTVLAACQTVVALQGVVAREVPATVPVVLSFGKIVADGATNVIPSEVYIAGTMRLLSEQWRGRLKERIRQVATCICQSYNTSCDVDIRDGYPSVYNNPGLTLRAKNSAIELLGHDAVEDMPVRMTAEDFGFYTVAYPSVFYRFGVARPDGKTGGAHTSQFNPDESALATAPAVMMWIAINLLKE